MSQYLVCDGVIDTVTLTCSGSWQAVTSLSESFNPADLDPVLIAGAVGAGFFCLVPVWAAGLGVRYLLNSIRG